MIELGGTIGDIESMPFIEALRQLKFSLPETPGLSGSFGVNPRFRGLEALEGLINNISFKWVGLSK